MRARAPAYLLPGLLLAVTASAAAAPRTSDTARVAEGVASWYGASLRGCRTASGEPFNPDALTAAHRTLPLGTRVKVTHRATGRRVVVRINDRGPFHRGRIIDLSRAAARALGILARGHARVRLEVVPKP